MGQQKSAGLSVSEARSKVSVIQGVPTAVAGFVIRARSGKVGTAVGVSTFTDFVAKYGEEIAGTFDWVAVEGFFRNARGAGQAQIVRTVHYIDDPDDQTGKMIVTGTKAHLNAKVSDENGAPDGVQFYAKDVGTYGNGLAVQISDSLETGAKKFAIGYPNAGNTALLSVIETIDGVHLADDNDDPMDPADPSSFDSLFGNDLDPDVSAKCATINAKLLLSGGLRPTELLDGVYHLASGTDGTAPVEADYKGVNLISQKTGIYAFDFVKELALLACPGMITPGMQNAMLEYAAARGDLFCVLDCPADLDESEIKAYVNGTGSGNNGTPLNSSYGAIYWPRIIIQHPTTGKRTTVPSSGHVLGCYARTDDARGVWKVAAGTEDGKILGAVGVEYEHVNLKEIRDVVYPNRINPIYVEPGYGTLIWGARTLDKTGEHRHINSRRTFIYAEKSVRESHLWAVFENIDGDLFDQIYPSVFTFLNGMRKDGGLKGKTPEEAFYIINETTNSMEENGQVRIRIGLATKKPAEFVEFVFEKDLRALLAELGLKA